MKYSNIIIIIKQYIFRKEKQYYTNNSEMNFLIRTKNAKFNLYRKDRHFANMNFSLGKNLSIRLNVWNPVQFIELNKVNFWN